MTRYSNEWRRVMNLFSWYDNLILHNFICQIPQVWWIVGEIITTATAQSRAEWAQITAPPAVWREEKPCCLIMWHFDIKKGKWKLHMVSHKGWIHLIFGCATNKSKSNTFIYSFSMTIVGSPTLWTQQQYSRSEPGVRLLLPTSNRITSSAGQRH